MDTNSIKNFRHNYIVNTLDGGFFGFALGLASFTTIIPLFVSSLTPSATLIGLIPALHTMGWQLPQLFTARRISRMPRYKPYVMLTALHERLPFIGLAVLAWFSPRIGVQNTLVLTFVILLWQGLGGGFAANAWQNMLSRVIPTEYLATFFGVQSSASSLLASGSAVVAGILLERMEFPTDFALCFLAAGLLMLVSYFFVSLTREPAREVREVTGEEPGMWSTILEIFKRNGNFRSYLFSRMLSQFGMMAFAFYTVYAVEYLHMSEATAGVMTSVLFITQVISNPIMGRVADRWSRKGVIEVGSLCIIASALLAWLAPSLVWFAAAFVLAGISYTAFWTVSMAFTLDFGSEEDRPIYVGMANTLIAPSAIIAPLLGGFLADTSGYPTTFITAAAAGLCTVLLLHFFVRDPESSASTE